MRDVVLIRSSHTTRQTIGVCITNRIPFAVEPSLDTANFLVTVDESNLALIEAGLAKIQQFEGVRA